MQQLSAELPLEPFTLLDAASVRTIIADPWPLYSALLKREPVFRGVDSGTKRHWGHRAAFTRSYACGCSCSVRRGQAGAPHCCGIPGDARAAQPTRC
jgi:hypothetical protein